jgi:hypothetical protein
LVDPRAWWRAVESPGRRTPRRTPRAPRPGRGVRSEVVAGVGNLQDSSDVLLKVRLRLWLALQPRRSAGAGPARTRGIHAARPVPSAMRTVRRQLAAIAHQRRYHLRELHVVLMTGLKSGSADATPAPGVNDNARAPTAASSLANDSVPICGDLPPNAAPNPKRRRHQRSEFESATTPHPCPLAAGDQGRPDGPSARVYRATQDRARQVLFDAQRKR